MLAPTWRASRSELAVDDLSARVYDETAKLKEIARDLLTDYPSGDSILQAIQEDYPEADRDEILRLRNKVRALVDTAAVTVSWADDEGVGP